MREMEERFYRRWRRWWGFEMAAPGEGKGTKSSEHQRSLDGACTIRRMEQSDPSQWHFCRNLTGRFGWRRDFRGKLQQIPDVGWSAGRVITGDSEVPGEIGVNITYIINNCLAFGQRFGQSAIGTDQAPPRPGPAGAGKCSPRG